MRNKQKKYFRVISSAEAGEGKEPSWLSHCNCTEQRWAATGRLSERGGEQRCLPSLAFLCAAGRAPNMGTAPSQHGHSSLPDDSQADKAVAEPSTQFCRTLRKGGQGLLPSPTPPTLCLTSEPEEHRGSPGSLSPAEIKGLTLDHLSRKLGLKGMGLDFVM